MFLKDNNYHLDITIKTKMLLYYLIALYTYTIEYCCLVFSQNLYSR